MKQISKHPFERNSHVAVSRALGLSKDENSSGPIKRGRIFIPKIIKDWFDISSNGVIPFLMILFLVANIDGFIQNIKMLYLLINKLFIP